MRRVRRFVLGLLALLLLVTVVGACSAKHSYRQARTLHGLSCAYHGLKIEQQIRRHHPLWTSYHVWRAVHSCHRAAYSWRVR